MASKGDGEDTRARAAERPERPDLGREANEVRSQLAPHLRDALDALIEHEAKILETLRDPAQAERFFHDPAGALEAAGIELPSLLRKRLRRPRPGLSELLAERVFRLPTGASVRPRLRFRFGPRRED